MNPEKVVFGFFVLLAATLNSGFFLDDIADPRVHNINEPYLAVVNIIATLLEFGDRTQTGAVHLATSLVADIQVLAAAGVWICVTQATAPRPWQRRPRGILRRAEVEVPAEVPSVDTVFLVLRRVRVPLVGLVIIFAVSVARLALTSGQDGQGNPTRVSVFDTFYFMSFTATTIGFGELPHACTTAQQMGVTVSICSSVVGWAYAIGTLFSLLQDHGSGTPSPHSSSAVGPSSSTTPTSASRRSRQTSAPSTCRASSSLSSVRRPSSRSPG